MKTKTTNRNRTHRSAHLSLAATLAATLLIGSALVAGSAGGQPDSGARNSCRTTAQLVLQAARTEATSEYWLDLARASTLPTAEERDAAKKQAKQKLKDSTASAKEQFAARLQVCEILGEGRYHPVINPDDFMTPEEIAAHPNPYLPLMPGTTYTYVGPTDEGIETNIVTVTHDTKKILGVTTVVVHDVVYRGGELKEDTLDWYAQDKGSNVWYFGELTRTYEGGEVTGIEGSWEAGLEGGKPGIIMKGNPQVNDVYRQEFSPGLVEDGAKVLALNQSVTVPYGSFTGCVQTGEFTPLEPETVDTFDQKFYAPGIGFIVEVTGATGQRSELVAIAHE